MFRFSPMVCLEKDYSDLPPVFVPLLGVVPQGARVGPPDKMAAGAGVCPNRAGAWRRGWSTSRDGTRDVDIRDWDEDVLHIDRRLAVG